MNYKIVICLCLFSITGVINACTDLFETYGKIDYQYPHTHSHNECWNIQVPDKYYIRIKMEKFSSDYGQRCPHSKVEIKTANGEVHTFCPGQNIWQPFIAFSDVTVTFLKSHSNYNPVDFTLQYKLESIVCAQKDSFECLPGNCITKSQVCDGTKDCLNGVDEKGCETGVFSVEGVDEARAGAVQWMENVGSYSTGWRENTHRAIIALHLASEKNFSESNAIEQLRIKQLEAQTLAALLRNSTDAVTINQLSMFVNALLVTCQDPRHFHGFDLVQMLKSQAEISSSLTSQPIAYLALCNANESLSENATKDLVQVLKSDSEYPFFSDVQAASVIALSCLNMHEEDEGNISDSRIAFDEAVKKLMLSQSQDGSFGNVYTTAIVTQALMAADQESNKDWNLKKAVKYLMDHLNSTSVDFLATYLTLPILNGKSISDIKRTNCTSSLLYKPEGDSLKDLRDRLGPKIRVQYSLYVGDDKDVIHTISLRVPEKVTAFEIMQIAEASDNKYRFQWKQMKPRIYVYDIANITNDFEDGKFWILYVGKTKDTLKHTTESPEKISVQDGDQVVMWYKKAVIN